MRHVVRTGQVPHLWARQSQDWAKNPQHTLSFQGKVLRSYNTEIARITDWRVGTKTVVLISSDKFSVRATARHRRAGWSALDDNAYYPLHVPETNPTRDPQHKLNAEQLYDVYHEMKKHDLYAQRVWAEGNTVEEKLLSLTKQLQRHLDKYNQYNRYVWKRKGYKDFFITEDVQEALAGVAARAVKRHQEEEEREEIRRKQRLQNRRENLVKWLEGDPHVHAHHFRGEDVHLRLTQRNGEPVVQTTMGAEVPEGHAQRIWHFIEMLRARGETYQHNGHTQHIGHFQVDRIDAEYTLHAGCHHIPYARMYEFALKTWGDK